MLQISPTTKIFVSLTPINFRNGIDGIARLCHELFEEDPMSGAYFAFRNRKGTAFKLLYYDGHGYWLCHRRLSQGTLKGWPATEAQARAMDPQGFMALMWNAEPQRLKPPWRRVG